MKEHEPQYHKPLLIEAVAQDYPRADILLVSFPEQWQLVQRIRGEDAAIYVASMPQAGGASKRSLLWFATRNK